LATLTQKMKKKTRAEAALFRILSSSKLGWAPRREDPFKTLIRTILSQNTSWQNEATAFKRLNEMIGVTPAAILNAKLSEIAEAIKPAGMYNLRSKTLKQVAAEVIERFDGDLAPIVSKPYIEAREILMTLPGVGEKTADVVLLFNAGKRIIPVDRHIARITKRLELVPENARYDVIRSALEKATTPEHYLAAHIKLIQFGRDICRAQNPKCHICILNNICPNPQRVRTPELAPNNKQPQNKPRKPKQTI
jgi:endonuclease III